MAVEIYVDADACPVKDEVYRVAARHDVHVHVVANMPLRIPKDPKIAMVVVPAGPDAADDWIAERASSSSIIVTADIPLASRGVKAGAIVLSSTGNLFDDAAIGMALAMRDLMDQLRSTGETTGGPKPFSPRDRSQFLQALESAVRRAKKND